MKLLFGLISRLIVLFLMVFVASACGSAPIPPISIPDTGANNQPPPSTTPQVVKETVLVVITATAPATAPPVIPTPAVQPAKTATATPTTRVVVRPSPTSLALLNIAIEGGDPNNMFAANLVFPDFKPAATTELWFRVFAHKPVSSKVDGEGIASVDFLILDSKGERVHYRQERQAGYCAFGGGEPDCTVLNFAASHYTWPDGKKIVSGVYTLQITATSKDDVAMFGKANFRIQVP